MGERDDSRGVYRKYIVTRADGSSEPGGKHEHCNYFVLDLAHDKHAPAALRAYADSCEAELPQLAHDLRLAAGHDRPEFVVGVKMHYAAKADEIDREHRRRRHELERRCAAVDAVLAGDEEKSGG